MLILSKIRISQHKCFHLPFALGLALEALDKWSIMYINPQVESSIILLLASEELEAQGRSTPCTRLHGKLRRAIRKVEDKGRLS